MGQVTDDDTDVILKKLGILFPSFYALYYVISLLYLLAFGLPFSKFGYFPFYIDLNDFKPELRDEDDDDRELPL
eukprot:gene18723-22358_t